MAELPEDFPEDFFVKVSEQSASHPLVKGEYFLTLPPELLKNIVDELGEERFDATLLGVERELAKLTGDGTYIAGFFDSRPVPYSWLRRMPKVSRSFNLDIDHPTLDWPLSREQTEFALTELDPVHKTGRRDLRAYCGWLMTNSKIQSEFDIVRKETADAFASRQLPQLGRSLPELPKNLNLEPVDERTSVAIDKWRDLYKRWMLVGFAAPGLPEPLGAQLPSYSTDFVPSYLRSDVTSLQIPHTSSIPDPNTLRQIIADSRRQSTEPHISGWTTMIDATNTGRGELKRYARLFELQHDWRLLHERHRKACHRKKGKLKEIFAKFLGVSEDTLRQDMRIIASRLGNDWHSRLN